MSLRTDSMMQRRWKHSFKESIYPLGISKPWLKNSRPIHRVRIPHRESFRITQVNSWVIHTLLQMGNLNSQLSRYPRLMMLPHPIHLVDHSSPVLPNNSKGLWMDSKGLTWAQSKQCLRSKKSQKTKIPNLITQNQEYLILKEEGENHQNQINECLLRRGSQYNL